MSPISSKNITPLLANSNLPILPLELAPEKAPLTYPNNSLSRRVSGIAPQLIAINGLFFLSLSECIALATNSFPVPLSPVINTVDFESAILLTLFFNDFIAFDSPKIDFVFVLLSPKEIFKASSCNLCNLLNINILSHSSMPTTLGISLPTTLNSFSSIVILKVLFP